MKNSRSRSRSRSGKMKSRSRSKSGSSVVYFLSFDDICDIFSDKVGGMDEETCGPFHIKNKQIILEERPNISPEDKKNSCLFENLDRQPNWYHTHPIKSKGYPSRVDILKNIKHADRKHTQLIFTKWGIWELKYNGSSDKELAERRSKDVDKINAYLYHNTENGKMNLDENNIAEFLEHVAEYIFNLKKIFGKLQIHFEPILYIEDHYKMKTIS